MQCCQVLQNAELTQLSTDPPATPIDRSGSSSLTPAVRRQLWTGGQVPKTLLGLDPLATGSEQPGGGTEPFRVGRTWAFY